MPHSQACSPLEGVHSQCHDCLDALPGSATCLLRQSCCIWNDAVLVVAQLHVGCRSASSGVLQADTRQPLVADPASRPSGRGKLYNEEALLQLVASGALQDGLEQLKDSLTPLVAGLRRTGRLGAVQTSFKEAASQRTKSIVR